MEKRIVLCIEWLISTSRLNEMKDPFDCTNRRNTINITFCKTSIEKQIKIGRGESIRRAKHGIGDNTLLRPCDRFLLYDNHGN